jgi:hypothetical protein
MGPNLWISVVQRKTVVRGVATGAISSNGANRSLHLGMHGRSWVGNDSRLDVLLQLASPGSVSP